MATHWLKPKQIADRLNIPLRTAYQLIADGDIPSARFSERVIRVDEADLDAFIESRRVRHADGRTA